MSDHSEAFRNDFIMQLANSLPPDQLQRVLSILDKTVSGYEISRRETSLICSDGIPDAVRWYLASKMVENESPGTITQYRFRLSAFFLSVKKPLNEITSNDIRLFLAYCKQVRHNSDSTIDGIRRVLNAFFSWCVNNEYLVRNPVAKIPKIRFQVAERVPLTSYEMEELRFSCSNIREKAIIDFLYSTGCRAGELVDVCLDDIDWSARSVVIRHGKGDKRRLTFFNAEAEFSLRKYLETRSDASPYLFVRSRKPHAQLSVRSIEIIIAKVRSNSGLSKRCSPHVLRHTFATASVACDMPLETLQALMGHAKPETTMIYVKLMNADLQRAHQKAFY